MNKLITLVLIFTCLSTQATTYYFDNSGSDLNAGTSPGAAWQTIAKFNSVVATASPGDNFLFNRNGTFYGVLNITSSGTSGSPITIGAYGTGNNPIITGFTTVSSWTNLGGNIWESSAMTTNITSCNMVVINGVNTPMGRWPNTGYNTISSPTATSITDAALTHDWTGARVVIRSLRYAIDTGKILSYSGGNTIHFTAHSNNPPSGWGYFIEADSTTLDAQNEWYYSPFTKKLRIYSTSSPTGVQVPTVDTLVYSNNQSYVTFQNIAFIGANQFGVRINNSNGEPYGNHFTFKNCTYDFFGLSAISVYASPYLKVDSCTFNHSNDYAINCGFAGSTNDTVTNNSIKNTGVFPGMGNGGYRAINSLGAHSYIHNNTIDTTGFNPIDFASAGTEVSNNLITYYDFVLDDGGGIYAFPNQGTSAMKYIKNNILKKGVGAGAGTDGPTTSHAEGIYIDGTDSAFTITGNSVDSCADGLYFNNSRQIVATGNNIFDCVWGVNWQKYTTTPMDSITFKHNTIVAKTNSEHLQQWFFYGSATVGLSSSYLSDSNYFAKPINDADTAFYYGDGSPVVSHYTLPGWKTLSSRETHSSGSPKAITDTLDLRIDFNATGSSVNVTTAYAYLGIDLSNYNGVIPIGPYSSIISIKNGAIVSGSTNKIVLTGNYIIK